MYCWFLLSSVISVLLLYFLNFYWGIIALQRCQVSALQQCESAVCTHTPPSRTSIPPPTAPLQVITEQHTDLHVPYSTLPLAVYFTHGRVYTPMAFSRFTPPPPARVHMSIPYTCVPIPALQVGSSVPSLYMPCIHVNIWYLSLPFWVTSLSVTHSRPIHIYTNDLVLFLLGLSNTLLCTCTTASPSIHPPSDI